MIPKVIEINGCVEAQNDITEDIFIERFIDFIELNGWYFGGGIKDVSMDE